MFSLRNSFQAAFICLTLAEAFNIWTLSNYSKHLSGNIDLTPVLYLAFVHIGLLLLFKKSYYVIGLMLAGILALTTIFLGGAIGVFVSSIAEFFGSSISLEDNEYTLLDTFISILTHITFFVVYVLSIPFEKIEKGLRKIEKKTQFGNSYIILASRIVEHIIHTVIPRTIKFLKEEGVLNDIGKFRDKSFFNGLMVGVVAECIVSAFEFLPLWIDELTAMRRVRGGKNG